MSADPKPAPEPYIQALCPECGLCCNGVLFGDVELQSSDRPEVLQARGLVLKRKGRKTAFPQPCACFQGSLCGIYADRPGRCRSFECGALKRVKAGQMTVPAALQSIGRARRQVQTVRRLLDRLGSALDEKLPLSRRFSRIMAQPIDLADDDSIVEARADLLLEVDKLMKLLRRDFLT